MKNNKSIKLKNIYYSIDKNQNTPVSLWHVEINPNKKSYGYEDDADVFGTAINVKTKQEGSYQGYINPSYPHTYNTQNIYVEEDDFGNISHENIDCFKLNNIFCEQEKFEDINALKTIYNHLLLLDFKELLTIDDMARFAEILNENLKNNNQKEDKGLSL